MMMDEEAMLGESLKSRETKKKSQCKKQKKHCEFLWTGPNDVTSLGQKNKYFILRF